VVQHCFPNTGASRRAKSLSVGACSEPHLATC
jgi:hypothetical protein